MAARRFNPLTYANKLKEVGLTEAQAEAIAQQQEELSVSADTHWATKEDLKLLATKSDLLSLKNEILVKVGGMLVVSISVLATFIKLVTH